MLATHEFRDRDHVFSYLTDAYAGKAPALHCFTFLLDRRFSLDEALGLARDKGIELDLTKRSEDLYLLRVGVRTSYEIGHFFAMDNNWLFLSDGQTAKLNSTIGALAKSTFPALKLAYVPSKTLLKRIAKIAERYDQLIVSEGTIRTKGQTSRNWKTEPVGFTIRRMEREADNADGKWTSISFRGLAHGSEVLSCRIYERGHLTLYSGRFPEFYQDVVLPYLSDARGFHERLRGKERKETPRGPALHPLAFSLHKTITAGEMQLLRGEIIRNYAAAVTHPGNPMLMMELSDRNDGSGFDLYAYGSKVQIVPQLKATPGALTELIALIYDVLPTGIPPVTG